MAIQHRTVNSRVFGSVRKDADKDNSDPDLLVNPLPGVTLFDFGGLQIELEGLIVSTWEGSNPQLQLAAFSLLV